VCPFAAKDEQNHEPEGSHTFEQTTVHASDTMAPLLSPQQLDFYEANGYLILRASEHKLVQRTSDLKKWAEQVRSWPLEKGKWMPYFEVTASGEKQPMRTEKFVDYHEDWRSLICGDGLASILKQIAGEVLILCSPPPQRRRLTRYYRTRFSSRTRSTISCQTATDSTPTWTTMPTATLGRFITSPPILPLTRQTLPTAAWRSSLGRT